MNSQRIAEPLHAGASAAQLRTAFLSCNEAGINKKYKERLLQKTKKINSAAAPKNKATGSPCPFINLY